MRISGLSINLKSFNIIHNTSSRYDNLLTQMVSGKKIQKGSEDPILAQKSIYLSNLMGENEQYLKNANDAKSLIDYSESILGQGSNMLTRVKELAIQASSDTINNESREAIVKEMDQIILEIVNMGNQQYNGKYIFGGTNTIFTGTNANTKPFELIGNPATGVKYNGNNEDILFNISNGFQMASNIPGDEVFLQTIEDLIKVRNDIQAGNINDITNVGFDLIEDGIDRFINARTELGAKSNVTDATISRITAMDTELESSYSSLLGANIVEKQIEVASLEVSYQASLSVVGKLHSMSILNYIK